MNIDELFQDLFKHTLEDLIKKVRSGSATAAELQVAIRFLKDNGIDCLRTANKGLSKLEESLQELLPQFDEQGNPVTTIN